MNKHYTRSSWAFLSTMSFFNFISCSHQTVPFEYSNDTDAGQEIMLQQKRRDDAVNNQIDVFSPVYFKKASSYLETAKEKQGKGDSQEDVLEELGEARGHLDQAVKEGEIVKKILPQIAESRLATRDSGIAPFKDEFEEIDSQLKSITSSIDESKDTDVRVKSDIAIQYLALELKAIKQKKLSDVKNMIDQARNANAEDIMPEAFIVATGHYTAAERVIESDRHNDGKINNSVTRARGSAALLLRLLASEKTSRGQSPEQRANSVEKSDVLLSKNRESLAVKENENARFMQEERDDIVVKNAAASFAPSEADVYRQDGNLVIRLKAMQFPTGQSNLPAVSLALLEKVKTILVRLGPGNILIEGHTDAIGGVKANTDLSKKRANAVANYFTVDQNLSANTFQVAGYGYSKPISSNKTVQGRAQNRRVDIIIKTQKTI